MPQFSYTALDAAGAELSGLVDASSPEQAAATLRGRGLFPTGVGPVTPAFVSAEAGALGRVGAWTWRRPARPVEVAAFTRQLATLLRAGLPLLRALEVLARQERNRVWRDVQRNLADSIRSGGMLSDAMARHPRVFDGLYLSMVRAGEAGGVLDLTLERLAGFAEKSLRLRGRLRAALAYPLVVLTVAVLILAGLLGLVVPKFQQVFAELLKGAPLPALTRGVLAVSDIVKTHFILFLAAAIAAVVLFRMIRRTPAGGRWIDRALLRMPVLGDLWLKAIVARGARTFGTLLTGGVPMLSALRITADTAGNLRIQEALQQIHDRVKAGDSVARPLEATGAFPPLVASMVEVGEQSGQLPAMLGKVADIYDEEVDQAVAGLSSLVEPVLIVVLAVIVGTIVIALFLPIVRIVQLLS
jgi:type IV pilus assembly protein PilC